MDDLIQSLSATFARFPGIGPKQAKRFVFYLLTQEPATLERLAHHIASLKKEILQCPHCFRYFAGRGQAAEERCDLCADPNRDRRTLLLVEKDIDLDNIRKLGVYQGQYFVLGTLIPILEKKPEQKIRHQELLERLRAEDKDVLLEEVIIALSVTREGDNTVDYLKTLLAPYVAQGKIKLTLLGRGLSSGTEIEYTDQDTIKNALANRQ